MLTNNGAERKQDGKNVSPFISIFLPAFTSPVLAVVCGLRDGEPVGVRGLVELDVLNESMELLKGDSIV